MTFYDNAGRPHATMPISEDSGLPLYRAAPAQALERAAIACDQQADGTNGAYRTACLECADAVRAIRDEAIAATPAQPIAPASEQIYQTALEHIATDSTGDPLNEARCALVMAGAWTDEQFEQVAQPIAPAADVSAHSGYVEPARAAAPVSGQGATLADELKAAPFNLSPHMARAVVRHIDSRPRSEDSRSKLERAIAWADEFGNGDVSTSMLRQILASSAAPESSGESADEMSVEEDSYMYACDLLEDHWKKRAARGLEIGTQGSLCDGLAWILDRIEKLEPAPAAHNSAPSEDFEARRKVAIALGLEEANTVGMVNGKPACFSWGILLDTIKELAAPTGESLPGQGVPVGWVYGNAFWERNNPRLTDHIKQHGRALYDAAPTGASK